MWRAVLDHVNEVESRGCLQLDLVPVYAEGSRRSYPGRRVRDLTTAHEARKSPRGDYCSSYTSQMKRIPEFRFSATLSQEPEVELALV